MTNRTESAEAVRAIIEQYRAGTRNADISILKNIFHPNAIMTGYLGPDLLVGSPQPFFDHLAANPVAPEYRSEIVHLEVTGRTATARLIEDHLYGMSFVNDFHLLLSDGRWSIVSKLFHHD